MSLELTTRLTLSSCVSQLTDFYLTNLQPLLLEHGFFPVLINLCDLSGEAYDYRVQLIPVMESGNTGRITHLYCAVFTFDRTEGLWFNEANFSSMLQKNGMPIRNIYQCALHVCGDFIKFNEKGNQRERSY